MPANLRKRAGRHKIRNTRPANLHKIHPANPRLLPVASILLGASLWGVIWYPLRLLEAGGFSGVWLTLTLYATALAASLPFTWRALPEFTRRPWLLLLLMFAAGWTNIAFVEAVLHGNILRVLLLFYLSPLWAVIMGRIVLHETLSRNALVSLLLAMSGALVMLWDIRIGVPWPRDTADWFALSAGFAFALSNVLVRKMDDISVQMKSVGVWGGVVLVALLIIPLLQLETPHLTQGIFAGAVALGLFGILIMTVLVQYGVTHLPVHRSAVLALIELVAGALSQQLLTDETVSLREWAGGALILAGAYLSIRAASRAGL
jgi:drug/metabolite transporter (DMT)-like permease